MAKVDPNRTLKRADPKTIQDKFLVGYQGWFTCPGDGPPLDPHHHGWLHWFTYPIPDGGRPNTDLWPDVSEYSPSELFPAPGLKFKNGEQAFVFSSRNAQTVQRHFHWMALHGVDGAFLQRFLGQCDLEGGNQGIRDQRDEVGDRVREAAEKEGRVFAIMYDISGVSPERIQRVLEQDWLHLLRDKRVLDSPAYLHEKGKPVVVLWGWGMSGAGHDPAVLRACTDFIRNNTPGGAYIMGGGPAYWRTSDNDSDTNPEFVNCWLEAFDAISPWTIGRFGSAEHADRYAEQNVKGDLEVIRRRNEEAERGVPGRRHIDFIPVIFPGGSGFNLSEGKWGWNDIKRLGGQFLWRQIWNMRRQGIRTMYGAMWDEYDEGTAYMPVVSKKRQVPVHEKYNFMALDEDGFDLPPDWYMRIAGFAAEGLRSERMIHESLPTKELQDYWSTRPRYEDPTGPSASGSGSGKMDSWQEWEKQAGPGANKDEPPPPPYTYEAEPPRPAVETRPAVGALNAGQSWQQQQQPPQVPANRPPPAVPLTSRPSGPSSYVQPSQHAGPPPIPTMSRPHSNAGSPSAGVSALADDLHNTRISSSSPTRPPPNRLSPHSSRPSSTSRPTTPLRPPAETCPNPAFAPYPPGPSGPYQDSPYGPGASFPMPGFAPSPPAAAPAPSPGGWSAPTWPPPEWGVQSTPPGPPQPYGNYNNSPYGPPPVPPLRPRPSMTTHRPHGTTPSPGPPSPMTPPGQAEFGVGGFMMPGVPSPQAPPQPDYGMYAPPQGPPPPQAYGGYGGGGGYPPPTSPPPQHQQYGTPQSSYPGMNAGGGGSPPPPPQHPGGSSYLGHSTSMSSRPPGSGSGGSMFSPQKLQSFAQTGISTGSKLFNKLKK